MRPVHATWTAAACAFLALIAAVEGWRRAARAEATVGEQAAELRDLDGAIQALHHDLDQLRGDLRRATETLEQARSAR